MVSGHHDRDSVIAPARIQIARLVLDPVFDLHIAAHIGHAAEQYMASGGQLHCLFKLTPGETPEVGSDQRSALPGRSAIHRDIDLPDRIDTCERYASN